MFLTADELTSHLYGEVMNEISRDDSGSVDDAIGAAIEQVRGYIPPIYDIDAIFDTEGNERSILLVLYTKDIAVWHFIQLGNVSTEMELREKRYDSAIKELEKIQKGIVNLKLPYKPLPDDGTPAETAITFSSVFPKRVNNF